MPSPPNSKGMLNSTPLYTSPGEKSRKLRVMKTSAPAKQAHAR